MVCTISPLRLHILWALVHSTRNLGEGVLVGEGSLPSPSPPNLPPKHMHTPLSQSAKFFFNSEEQIHSLWLLNSNLESDTSQGTQQQGPGIHMATLFQRKDS